MGYVAKTTPIRDQHGELEDLPVEVVHNLTKEEDLQVEEGTRTVSPQEVRESVGKEREAWVQAIEREHQENFLQRHVYTISTEEEKRRYGVPLPMKMVFTKKQNKKAKARAVVCGNFERNNLTADVWTAQAETSSIIVGTKLAMSRRWKGCILDVKGAFMYAPLPKGTFVVVRPPKAFVEVGICKADECWTLCSAVYGLRIAPKAWGAYRDHTFRNLSWKTTRVNSENFRLEQSEGDSQLWKLYGDRSDQLRGIMLVYVDDFLLFTDPGEMRDSFVAELESKWTMTPPVDLVQGNPVTFLGIEFHANDKGILLTQQRFTHDILKTQYGFSEWLRSSHDGKGSRGTRSSHRRTTQESSGIRRGAQLAFHEDSAGHIILCLSAVFDAHEAVILVFFPREKDSPIPLGDQESGSSTYQWREHERPLRMVRCRLRGSEHQVTDRTGISVGRVNSPMEIE